MFVNLPVPIPHRDPWFLTVEKRLSRFIRGAHRIAYFYERTDNSTFRYRVHNMIDVIEATWPDASASYFTLADGELLDKVADAADILVICRARYSDRVSRLICRAKRRGIPVFFDTDDFVFDARYAHLIMNTLDQTRMADQDWDFWFAYIGRIGATLRQCDRVITTNGYLAERIKAFSGLEASIVPNFMNEAQLRHSEHIFKAKQSNGFARDEHLHIGYFSGSPTHVRDFALAESALTKILDRYPQTRIRMVGYMEPAGAMLSYASRIDRHPFQDYVNLQGLIGSTEINIAPLQDNFFTNCKSELKFFEAAVTGTATIASPTYSFAQAIRPGDTGRLAAAHQWEEMIGETVEDLISRPEDYIAMAERAQADVKLRYGWQNQAEVLRQALT